MHLSSWEVALLLLLMASSLAVFGLRLGKVLRVIRNARETPDFALQPVSWRLRHFLSEVLLQVKVIRERPLPGLAHAFVFWGFCAFALITINHFAAGFGATFLTGESVFGRFYIGFVAVFAVAVAVSIAGLAIRRFVVRPLWLGPLSLESGFIAFLIFALMATYLAALWLPEEETAGKVNWWLHTLALLIFLPLIPHTKHLHLALSPVTVFLRRHGFSRIPPLEGDEDFGIDTGKDLTRIDALQAFSCVECGRCTEACPAFNTGKVLNPKEVILNLRGYLKEQGPRSESEIVGPYVSEEAIFQCTTCGGCEFQCPVGIQHLPMIIGLRRGRVNTGKWTDDYGAKLFEKMERNGNSLGFPASERQKFIEKNEIPYFDGSQEYCLWLGCMGSYDPQGREIVLALTRVLRHSGITFGVLRREKCSGDPARRLGNDYLFQQLAESNIEQLQSAGARKLVSICPHCVRTIGTDWREAGATFDIEHHSELLARIQASLPAASDGSSRAVYHDPCYLGRYRDVYEQPREVVAQYQEVVEAPRSRERSFCCGAGGGMMFLGEEKGRRVNRERAAELAKTGAPVIATACPFCQTMFRDALGASGGPQPQLLDVVQIVAASLPRT